MEKTELTVSMEPERLDALRYFLAAKNKRTPQKELQRALEELYPLSRKGLFSISAATVSVLGFCSENDTSYSTPYFFA